MKREPINISTYLKSSEHRKHTNDSASDFNIQAMCFKFLNLNFFSMIVNGRVIWRMIEDDITFKKRKQQSIFHRKCKMKSSNSSIFIYPVAELFSYAHDLTTKRRNCGSRFLVPDTPCIWYSNRWKCSLFERMIDMFTDSNAIALQGETMGMHKVRIVSLSPKITITSRRLEIEEEERRDICSPAKEKILIWHDILEVPEETDCNGITSVNIVPVAVSSKYFCERHVSDHNLKIEKSRKKNWKKETSAHQLFLAIAAFQISSVSIFSSKLFPRCFSFRTVLKQQADTS
ncbi:hypothetical protein Tsp_02785 [Trichinella spiralis]|uniref:hypothetical protein n=1 Tax=Trichinella spiralis TaxID=6334 RepID=UPI0001EFC580|nr:hypothetical protein Tsp_02785 [Trichinella spiralis]